MSRPELVVALERAGLEPVGQRTAHMIYYAAQKGILCLGPFDGKEQLFVLYDEWIPERVELDHDDALAELARRYLIGHGPASEADLAWWAGITVTDARRGVAALGDAVERLDSDGDAPQLLVLDVARGLLDADRPGRASPASVLLAPGFDETLLGYRDRSYTVRAEHSPLIVPGGNGVFMATIQRDGQAVGLWRRTDRGRRIELVPQPFAPLPKTALTGIARSARRYGAFRGMPVTVTEPLP